MPVARCSTRPRGTTFGVSGEKFMSAWGAGEPRGHLKRARLALRTDVSGGNDQAAIVPDVSRPATDSLPFHRPT